MALNGKRIVILGGTSGIGLATARAAALASAQTVIVSRNPARVDEARKQIKGAEGYALDLADAAAVQTFFAQLGAFDHLVFTAGESLQLDTLAKTDLATARRFFDLRYWGAYQAAKFGAGQIRAGGSIVFTSGIAAARPRAGWALGASICAAMEGLTRALAVELAPVRVNIVAPGVVKTPLWSTLSEADREALYASQAAQLPVRHIGEAEEIAKAYIYLMEQTYGTGQVLTVDGGAVLV